MKYWHNLRTKQLDAIESMDKVDNPKDYISQDPASQNLYELYIIAGDTQLDAVINCLKAILGL